MVPKTDQQMVVSGVRCIQGKTFDQLLPSFLITSVNVSGASGAEAVFYAISATLDTYITRLPRSLVGAALPSKVNHNNREQWSPGTYYPHYYNKGKRTYSRGGLHR